MARPGGLTKASAAVFNFDDFIFDFKAGSSATEEYHKFAAGKQSQLGSTICFSSCVGGPY